MRKALNKAEGYPEIPPFHVCIADIVKNIGNECKILRNSTTQCLSIIQSGKMKVSDQAIDILLEHDLREQNEVRTDNQREYLIRMGPYQLMLSSYLMHKVIPSGKQNRFCSVWYEEYPHLVGIQYQEICCLFLECSLLPEGPGLMTGEH